MEEVIGMSDIKTREVNKGYIRTIDHATSMGEHMRSVAIKVREQAEFDGGEGTNNASSYASDDISYAAKDAVIASTRAARSAFDDFRNTGYENGTHIDLKTKVDMVRETDSSGVRESEKVEKSRIVSNKFEEGRKESGKVDFGREGSKKVENGLIRSKKVESGRTMSDEVEKSRALARKVDSARKAGTLKNGARGASNAGKVAVKSLEKAVATFLRAVRVAIESTKAMVMALSAGGIAAVVIVIICVLFGAAFYMFGDDSSANYTPVSEEVDAYTEIITKYAEKYGIPEYVELIKAVMMQESGGRGDDPMQCSESPYNKKYPKKPGGIKDPEYSIDCGVHYLANCLNIADCEGPLDMERIRLAIQGYNYGNGYIPWAIKRDGGYTVQNAAIFSRQQAKKHGWKSYGDKLYAAHVLRYYPYGNYNYGIGNAEIIKVAASQLGNVGGDKYWKWYGFKSHVAWCTIFVSWCADQCGYVKAGIIPKYSNCRDTMRWFKAKHQYQNKSYTPAEGDIIWFDWNGDGKADHIGFVESCDGKGVHTIEGNSGNRCRRKTYPKNSYKILGYGIPKY